jgi:DNA gyrase subunit A
MSDIRVMGRATQGVRVINLEKRNDTIASVCTVATDPEEQVEMPDNEIDNENND